MQLDAAVINGAIRLSLGKMLKEAELAIIKEKVSTAVNQLRSQSI
jgi:cysteine sulfinate desulfinase/cysteine desulfurase-like protein